MPGVPRDTRPTMGPGAEYQYQRSSANVALERKIHAGINRLNASATELRGAMDAALDAVTASRRANRDREASRGELRQQVRNESQRGPL
jgi:hypothetical protein